ncbi:chromosome partitioning protein [Streptomyces phytophilus]|uniref:chromosome partitioning protein n=1 Tax=Streptomyces phytophilus TaxID=722715 RepID=UPI0015F0DBA7|nr:chromosome partitioning protein [Streptomyces phytophilus]
MAVAVAAGWPSGGHPVVVECDPAGGDLLARFRLDLKPGLVTLAAAARRTAGDPGLIWQHTQRLPGGGLPVVPGPLSAEQARAALAELTGEPGLLVQAAARPDVAVIVDCGRIGADAAALALIRAADVMLLVTGTSDDSLAHLAVALPAVSRLSARPRLVLVGEGYATEEIVQALEIERLGVRVTGRMPYDPAGAAPLTGRPSPRSAPSRSRLGQAAAALAVRTAQDALITPPAHLAGRFAGVPAPAGPDAPGPRPVQRQAPTPSIDGRMP